MRFSGQRVRTQTSEPVRSWDLVYFTPNTSSTDPLYLSPSSGFGVIPKNAELIIKKVTSNPKDFDVSKLLNVSADSSNRTVSLYDVRTQLDQFFGQNLFEVIPLNDNAKKILLTDLSILKRNVILKIRSEGPTTKNLEALHTINNRYTETLQKVLVQAEEPVNIKQKVLLRHYLTQNIVSVSLPDKNQKENSILLVSTQDIDSSCLFELMDWDSISQIKIQHSSPNLSLIHI
eukprot:TRINITY_DN7996_c0_g1_i2.p1 TRINITY_DN7996_c0_g1~~TRINITY_DN7996_c0_g1_i2.p1  ORF type:complete len:232 (-),score=30.85 TRINITY_DN7996_c0_g1_i2:26-721(-)